MGFFKKDNSAALAEELNHRNVLEDARDRVLGGNGPMMSRKDRANFEELESQIVESSRAINKMSR